MRRIIILLFVNSFFLKINAQVSPTASGKNIVETGGSISYSVGQVVYLYKTDNNSSFIEGVQQPYEISEVLDLSENFLDLKVDIFPNPTSNYLTIKMGTKDFSDLDYSIYNSIGKVILEKKKIEELIQIDMQSFATGIYFLQINQNQKLVKSYKIIKK
jgi:hypothetical protein